MNLQLIMNPNTKYLHLSQSRNLLENILGIRYSEFFLNYVMNLTIFYLSLLKCLEYSSCKPSPNNLFTILERKNFFLKFLQKRYSVFQSSIILEPHLNLPWCTFVFSVTKLAITSKLLPFALLKTKIFESFLQKSYSIFFCRKIHYKIFKNFEIYLQQCN